MIQDGTEQRCKIIKEIILVGEESSTKSTKQIASKVEFGKRSNVMLDNNTLMLVTNRQGPIDDYLKFIDLCARSGITAVQLREKNASLDFIISFGLQLKTLLANYGLPLIVNDSLEAALKIDAHGLHLGQSDGDPVRARKAFGDKKIIGVSVTSIEEAQNANNLPINYIGAGPVFNTASKADAKPALGIDMLKKIISISKHPVIAIGGIDEENVGHVASSGVCGIAVIGAVHQALMPELTIARLNAIISQSNTAQ